jgi:Ca2+-binding EF-hand superfamily protein
MGTRYQTSPAIFNSTLTFTPLHLHSISILLHNHNHHQTQRFGLGKVALSSAFTYFLGAKIHSGRAVKKLKKKHQQDQKTLYTQYYNDIYKLEEQKAEQQYIIDQLKHSLSETTEKHEMEALQREYDEFKQPDVDGDDRISRTEFNMYVKNYLSNYPGLTEKDYPKFEDFDHDHDGYVSFQEYAQQMAVQAQQAELDQYYAQSQGKSGQKEAAKANALYDLYGSAANAHTAGGGFDDLYAQIRR